MQRQRMRSQACVGMYVATGRSVRVFQVQFNCTIGASIELLRFTNPIVYTDQKDTTRNLKSY